MTNFSAKILNNAVSSLLAQQAVIGTTGNNIANVNTPGYARRVAELQNRVSGSSSSGLNIGSGVEVNQIRRVVDTFLERQVTESTSDQGSYGIESDFMSRIDRLFSLDPDKENIGSTMTKFFGAVNDLAADPASIELRTNVIERMTDVVNIIKTTFSSLASMQKEADQRISSELETVNSLTGQIADLNQRISQAEVTGNVAGDERDKRDLLVNQLAEKVSFASIEDSTGSLNISLSNGFPLVFGNNHRDLSTTTNPSFGAGSLPPSLGGEILSYVVYDFDQGAGTSHFDLTQALQAGSGTVGGLLKLRGFNAASNTSAFQADGTIVEIASRVEALTRSLLSSVNSTYLGPDRDPGTVGHQASSGDLNGALAATTNPYALFDFAYGGATPKDADSDGLPNDLGNHVGVDNYSSILTTNFTDPRRFSAARDASAGPPAAAIFPQGDGRNALALAALENQVTVFSAGTFTRSSTYGELYNDTVGFVGNATSRAKQNSDLADSKLLAAQTRRDEVSAVSLDEEFANLIKFQKAYEASARMIKIGDSLLEQIIALI